MDTTSTHVPRIDNLDDHRQHAFARQWVLGFKDLEVIAERGQRQRFVLLARRLRDELRALPEIFALNREAFVWNLVRLQAKCTDVERNGRWAEVTAVG